MRDFERNIHRVRLVKLVTIDDLVGVGLNDILEVSSAGHSLGVVDNAVIVVLNGVAERILYIVDVDDVLGRIGGNGDLAARGVIAVELVAVLLIGSITDFGTKESGTGVRVVEGIIAFIDVVDGVAEGILHEVDMNHVLIRIGSDRQRNILVSILRILVTRYDMRLYSTFNICPCDLRFKLFVRAGNCNVSKSLMMQYDAVRIITFHVIDVNDIIACGNGQRTIVADRHTVELVTVLQIVAAGRHSVRVDSGIKRLIAYGLLQALIFDTVIVVLNGIGEIRTLDIVDIDNILVCLTGNGDLTACGIGVIEPVTNNDFIRISDGLAKRLDAGLKL